MGLIAWTLLGLGAGLLAAILLLAHHLATSWTARTDRHSHHGYDSRTPALVRAEKRLYLAWQPPASVAAGSTSRRYETKSTNLDAC